MRALLRLQQGIALNTDLLLSAALLAVLQCCDAVGWVSGRASGL